MVGSHHQLVGHEFQQALGAGDGEWSLACWIPRGLKELDMTEQLNWSKLNQKMGGGPKETLIQLRHIDGQQTYEKMINITNHQGNANQNHSELSPHTHQNSYHWTELKKKKKNKAVINKC